MVFQPAAHDTAHKWCKLCVRCAAVPRPCNTDGISLAEQSHGVLKLVSLAGAMLPLVSSSARRALVRSTSGCARTWKDFPGRLGVTINAPAYLSTSLITRAAGQEGSLPAGPPPWVRATTSGLAMEFDRAASYEDQQGFGDAQGERRFSEFLHDLLCRARQATAHDPATYRLVATLAAEAQRYPTMRVPERALFLVRSPSPA